MNLAETLKATRDSKLPLPEIERLRDELIRIKTQLHMRIADLKKKRAIFLMDYREKYSSQNVGHPMKYPSVAEAKMTFDATEDGQKLLEYIGMIQGLSGEISSLQGRIYSLIR